MEVDPLTPSEVQKFLKSQGNVGKGGLLVDDVYGSRLHSPHRIEMSSIHIDLAATPWQEHHPQDLGMAQLKPSSMDTPVQSEDPEEVEIDFEQLKQLAHAQGSERSEPSTETIFHTVIHFDMGSADRYTDAQIRHKFG